MNTHHPPSVELLDDPVAVEREHLYVLLMATRHIPAHPVVMNAQAQLERALMSPDPPTEWFDNELDDEPGGQPDDEDDTDGDAATPDEAGEAGEDRPVGLTVAGLVAAASALLVLFVVGIAWLVVTR